LNGIEGTIEDSTIADNEFNNATGAPINIQTSTHYSGAYGILIANNIISGYQGYGGNTGNAITCYCPFPNITGNKINRKTGSGIVIVADNAVITNNSIQKMAYHGISVTGHKAVISGNHVLDCDNANTDTYSGIVVAGNYGLISGNISGNASGTPGGGVGGQLYGLRISSGSGNTIGFNAYLFNKTAQMLDSGTGNVGLYGEGFSRRILFGTAAPTSGTWAVGDVVINKTPASGQPKGWRCTSAGPPAVWTSEGNL
jgi:hypothetical protein